MAETQLRKHMCIPFIDVAEKVDGAYAEQPSWKRIDKSTVFEIAMNANTESFDYISMETPTEEIKYYAPSMDQEISTYAGNPIYEYMMDKFYNFNDTDGYHGRTLICFPKNGSGEQVAWYIEDTSYVLNNMNFVDGKLTWSMKFNGDFKRGTWTAVKGTDGALTPTFVEEDTEEE